MIQLHGMTSPNVLKVALMLEECGLAYRLQHVDVFGGAQLGPGFLAMNPNGRVPVLHDPDADPPLTLFESGAILLHLAQDNGLFLPEEPAARSAMLPWLMFQLTTAGPAFGQYVHFFRYAADETYALRRYESEAARVLSVLERRLEQSAWLSGDDYGLADIATWPGIRTADAMFPLLVAPRGWARLPRLRRWFDTVSARPAATRAAAAVETLLPRDKAAFANADADALDRFFGRGRHDHAAALLAG